MYVRVACNNWSLQFQLLHATCAYVQILINYAYACTYYSGIMLVAEKHQLFQKLCQHIGRQANLIYTILNDLLLLFVVA